MRFVYEKPEKRLKELVIVRWNFYMKKVEWAISDKKFIVDSYPVCYQYYDSCQKRDLNNYHFLLHKYLSLSNKKKEKQFFVEYFNRCLEEKRQMKFIDSLTYAIITNSRELFIEHSNNMLLNNEEFLESLKKYQNKKGWEKEIKVKCPGSFIFNKSQYENVRLFFVI